MLTVSLQLTSFAAEAMEGLSPEEVAVQSLLQSLTRKSISSRVDEISLKFFAKPYLVDPLGEGPAGRFDQDPKFRLDAFDCTTFVETVSALAISKSLPEFEHNIDAIRYLDAKVSFETRNHFTDLDWIPNNIQAGFVTDLTRSLFGSKTKVAKALIEKEAWYSLLSADRIHIGNNSESPVTLIEELRNLGKVYFPVEAQIDYAGIHDLTENPELLERIPSGTIINFVRPNWHLKKYIGTNMNISHQGLAIRKKTGVLYFRHASKELMVVTEEPLLDYLNRMLSVKTIDGINILKLNPAAKPTIGKPMVTPQL